MGPEKRDSEALMVPHGHGWAEISGPEACTWGLGAPAWAQGEDGLAGPLQAPSRHVGSLSSSPSALLELGVQGSKLGLGSQKSCLLAQGWPAGPLPCPCCQKRASVNKCCSVFAGKPCDTPLLSSPRRAVSRVQAGADGPADVTLPRGLY